MCRGPAGSSWAPRRLPLQDSLPLLPALQPQHPVQRGPGPPAQLVQHLRASAISSAFDPRPRPSSSSPQPCKLVRARAVSPAPTAQPGSPDRLGHLLPRANVNSGPVPLRLQKRMRLAAQRALGWTPRRVLCG